MKSFALRSVIGDTAADSPQLPVLMRLRGGRHSYGDDACGSRLW